MSNEKKERRCKACGKLLIDEKMPVCRRCVLEVRNTGGKIGGIISGVAISLLSAAALKNNQNDVNGQV